MLYYSVFGYKGQPTDYHHGYSDWFVVHNPYVNEDVSIYDAVLNKQDNVSGAFTFKAPLTHPNILQFDCGLIVEIRRFSDVPESIEDANYGGDAIWIGRLIDLSVDIYGNLDCTCEGPLGFLKDCFVCSINAPVLPAYSNLLSYFQVLVDSIANGPQGEYNLINPHNRQPGLEILEIETDVPERSVAEQYLHAQIGALEGFSTCDNGMNALYSETQPTNLFDFIHKYYNTGLSSISGIQYRDLYIYMNMEVVSNSRYDDLSVPKSKGLKLILGADDLMARWNYSGAQRIIFGDNLINADIKYDFDSIATSLMVLGSEYDHPDPRYKDIKFRYSVSSMTDPLTGNTIFGPYIDSTDFSIEKYGVIQKTVVNDDLDSAIAVLNWADAHRNALSNPVASFSCTAVDLSLFDTNQNSFELGTYAEVSFPGLDNRDNIYYYRCTGLKKNLSDPSKDEFTFSYTKETSLTSNSIFKKQSTTAGSPSAYDSSTGGSSGSSGGGSDTPYTLPVATSEVLGGVKVGEGLDITEDGVLSTSGGGSDLEYVIAGQKEDVTLGPQATSEGIENQSTGPQTHVEGTENTASGAQAHAEGKGNRSVGGQSHSEGNGNTTYGYSSHVEGYKNELSYIYGAHVEGINNTTTAPSHDPESISGNDSFHVEGAENKTTIPENVDAHAFHVEGFGNAVAPYTTISTGLTWKGVHVEGNKNTYNLPSSYVYGTHIEGDKNNISSGYYEEGFHVEGTGNTYGPATNMYSQGVHIEGRTNKITRGSAQGYGLHFEGDDNQMYFGTGGSMINGIHVEGTQNYMDAPGHNWMGAHIGGYGNRFTKSSSGNSGMYYGAHFEGQSNAISSSNGISLHVEGNSNLIQHDVNATHVEGYGNLISSTYRGGLGLHVGGKYANVEGSHTYPTYQFVLGGGSGSNDRRNVYIIYGDGSTSSTSTYSAPGADYAEMFEWADGNPNNEDRVGRFVKLDGEHILFADGNTNDEDVIGIVSASPSVVGDAWGNEWVDRYLKDPFGRIIYETVLVPEQIDKNGNIIMKEHEERRPKINPEYDNGREYQPRGERSEWACVGLMGKLVVLDDGTARVNGFVYPSENGIATRADFRTRYRVMSRVDDTHIKVLIL